MTNFIFNFDPAPAGTYIGSGPVSIIYAGYGMPPGYQENFNFSNATFGNITQLNFNYMSGMSMPGKTTFKSSQFGAGLISNSLLVYGATGETDIIVNMNTASFDASGWTFAPNDYSEGINWIQITSSGGIVGDIYNDYATDFVYINGDASDNTILGSIQSDVIDGKIGNDTITGGLGNDDLKGGDGIDTASYATAASAVVVDLGNTGWQATGGAGSDRLTAFENLTGSSHNDTLTGNAGANALGGRAGNDSLKGLGGNDELDGGEGIDTAIFTGNLANYTISNINGVFTVADNRAGSPDGTDTVIFTEKFQFADQTIDVTSSAWDGFVYRDLSGNGAADLLWLHSLDYVALLTNASGGFGSLGASTTLPAGYIFANFAQIDGAGGYEPIWSKSGTGVMIGNGAGTPLTFTQKAVAQPNGVGWSYWQSADMNGDGSSELLWKYGESIGVTFLDASQNKVSDNWYGSPGAGWTAVAAADLNGDGRSDILWRNDAAGGALASTLTASDGKSFTSANWLSKPGAGWDYYGVGDFNGDGRADTAWTNQNDYMAVMMTGADGASTTGSYWFSKPGEGWEIQGIGDFNNDGRADTLWWNDAVQGAADFLTEATLNSSGDPNAYGYWLGSPGAGWSYAGLGDFNGDQRMDTLFQNAAGDAASLITNAAGSAAAPQWIGSPGTSWSLVG